ncbi:non-ribosomal peptide synthetase, partial [Flavobacterium aquidurense]|uniref:non-ribosomal peptide synthetase n=1 Tax=Flavobacterium aquidurense TaxID=362413 RepID=UPI001FD7F12B
MQEQKGEKVLVAYYVSQDNIDKSDLRHFLQKELPEYMIPNFYVALDKVPLTPNGKVDRKALPGISESDIIRRAYVSPVSDHEIKLAVIWQDVLKVDQVGITDNFFELGGHSLIMVQVINHIFKELGKSLSFRDFFSNPTIEGLCGKLQESGYVPIPKAAAAVSYRLTSSQNRLWLLSQFEGGSLAYNMSTAVAFKGTIDHFHFQNAFRILIERHEILRTSFQITPLGEVMQFVKAAAEVHFEIPQKDFTGINAQGDALNAYLQQQNNAPFDLENAPLIRGTLAQLTQEDYVFQLSIHHIIGDGWSMEILVTELVTIYNALLSGTTANLEALRIQFKDYAVWMASDAQQEKLQLSGQYWLGQFSGDLPVLDLGYKARPSVQRYHGESLTHTFSKGFLQDLKHFSQQHDLTLFMTLMSGVNLLLHRYTGQDDIILGTPIAGREHQDLENQIGLYLNTLAVRTRLNSQGSFLDLVRHEKQVLLEAYDHQGYPLDELIGNLDLKRDMSRSALFDVLVVLQNQAENLSTAEELINLKVSSYELANKTSKFDLSYSFSQSDSLKLSITYNTDLYEAVFVERMFSHLEHLLSQAIANPAVLLKEIDYLTPLEQQELLIGFNTPLTSYSKEPVTALFEAQAKSNPMAAALVFGDKKVSYESLLEEVNSISDYLINKGVSRGDKIILCFESHLDKAIAGMLGILKAGAVYVPVDPDYPIERIEFIIADTQSKYVLSNTTDAALFANTDVEVILLDKLSPVVYGTKSISISGSDHAYVIYTSGSTGHPKGVLVNHKNISDYVSGLSSATAIESNTSFGLMSTIATDLGNTVLFSSLVFGKMLHLFSKSSLRDVDYIQAYFTAHSIDCIKIVPSYWRGLELGAAVGSPLKMIIFGGEELSIDLVRKIQSERAGIRIINHYGPTETTIGKLLHEVEADRDYYKIPIGRPFSNTRCYVVDEHLSLCPQGVVGELLIGGEGVSEGYLNNAGLTAQKFIADTFTDSPQKLYRTGDRVVMHFNGEIEFKGRIDNQVKILGHRIELSEIENVLNSHDAISSGVATVVSDAEGNQSLAAYVVYKTDAVEKTALLEFLRSRLPGIMIPASIVSIAEIPLTSNGKINRKALPAIDAADSAGRTYIAPESAVEIKLAQIWQEVLKTERVGITDNFFELGGNSLKVTQVVNKIMKETNKSISFKDFFSNPTIESINSKLISKNYLDIPIAPKADSYPVSPSQNRLWLLSQLEQGSLAYNMPVALTIKGEIDFSLFENSFQQLINRHEILRTYFKTNKEGELRQYIMPASEVKFKINYVDFTNKDKSETFVQEYIQHLNNQEFNFQQAPLLRASLIKVTANDHVFFFSRHHIISDGWSSGIISNEIIQGYNVLVRGEELILPEFKIQYKDYAIWLRDESNLERNVSSEKFWMNQFSGEIPALDLIISKSRPLIKTNKGKTLTINYSEDFLSKLKTYSKSNNVTLFMTLMSGINVLLHKYSGQNDIIIGTPIAGREHPELENQMGLYMNMLAIRTQVEEKSSFSDLLLQQKHSLLEAYEHQNYQFDELIGKLNLKRDITRSALFDVIVILQNHTQLENFSSSETLNALEVEDFEFERKTSQFDISFQFVESEGLTLSIDYNTDIYESADIERLMHHFRSLMESVLVDPSLQIDSINYLTDKERQKLLFDFNSTDTEYAREQTVLDLFEAQAKKSPWQIALKDDVVNYSYLELDILSNQIASYIISEFGSEDKSSVAVMLERSANMVALLLGILKSGRSYIPLDPKFPVDRLNYILANSEVKLLVNQTSINLDLETENVQSIINLETLLAQCNTQNQAHKPEVLADDTAYVIYTSGSTGNPKGVEIGHRSLVNFLLSMKQKPGISNQDTLFSVTTYSFDISILEFFLPLISGATLYVASHETLMDSGLIIAKLDEINPSVLQATPSFYQLLIEAGWKGLPGLKVLCGGEQLNMALIKKLKNLCAEIWNMYGPTETTIWSTVKKIGEEKEDKVSNIGSPINNTTIYILDNTLQLVPVGLPGAIYIGGDGLAKGY